jgi:phenylalanyl-tRNA synthetase beta chain
MLFGEIVGRLFEFHPNFVKGRGSVLNLDIEALMRLCRHDKRYVPARRFPSSAFDLSIVVDSRIPVGEIEDSIRTFRDVRIEAVQFVRQYKGAPLADHQKSVTFRFTVAAPDRTLSSEEISEIRNGLINTLSDRYELRV